MTRARELSRFTNENVFSVEANSFNVGLGSTSPDVKFDVQGSIEATGISTFHDNLFVGAGITMLASSGIVSAVSFYGDFVGSGEGLTGVASTDNILSNAITVSGVSTFSGGVGIADSIFHIGDLNTAIRFPAADTFTVETAGSERVRVTDTGRVGINSATPGVDLAIKNSGFCGLDIQSDRSSGTIGGIRFLNSAGDNRANIYGLVDQQLLLETGGNERLRINSDGDILPGADATQDLGATDKRFANIYSADLQLSNEGSSNDVDGTWGKYTIQEGEDDLFLINRRTGKKYKFMLEEV